MESVIFCKILPWGNCVKMNIHSFGCVCSMRKNGDKSTLSTQLSTERIPNSQGFRRFSQVIHRFIIRALYIIHRLWFILDTSFSNLVGFIAFRIFFLSFSCQNRRVIHNSQPVYTAGFAINLLPYGA